MRARNPRAQTSKVLTGALSKSARNSKFLNLQKAKYEKQIFLINFFSKHFSSVNMRNMEKMHTLKKICLDLKISFFNFLCARAHHQKMHFLTFLIHMLLILARSACATARAITKCVPIDSHDQIEVICTINHYRNLKIDEFAIC